MTITSKRLYYKDPLEAAWMAKHFGMRLTDGGDDNNEITATDDLRFFLHDDALLYGYTGKLYIHPDSLQILEPQPGDLVKVMRNVGYIPAGEGFAEKYALRMARSNCQPHATGRIIQRNGVAFMWPQSEAA